MVQLYNSITKFRQTLQYEPCMLPIVYFNSQVGSGHSMNFLASGGPQEPAT